MNQNEQQKKTPSVGGAVEQRMKKVITLASVIIMVVLPLIVCFGLRGLEAYVDNDLAVLHPSAAMTALQWVLYYLVLIMMAVIQYAGFGVIGYSVLRFGFGKSLVPILLSVVSAAITYISSIAEMIFVYGNNAVLQNIEYLGIQWIINFLLSLFTTVCVVFLCVMVRRAFIRGGRLAVGITKEDRAAKQKNVLRRLYLSIFVLLLAFNLVSSVMTTFAEIRQVGGPGNFWEFYTLIEPYFETILIAALGFFMQCRVGQFLTDRNAEIKAALEESLADG